MDVHSKNIRSYNMAQIKGENTNPEIIIRKFLFSQGYRYRIHYNKLPGKPDVVFPLKNIALFINGCFWHKHDCNNFKWPKSNYDFWKKKITGNVKRDNKNYNAITQQGWKYFVIWECEIKSQKNELFKRIIAFLES
jgi:DNA mismatch endonuclease, patch repair protein